MRWPVPAPQRVTVSLQIQSCRPQDSMWSEIIGNCQRCPGDCTSTTWEGGKADGKALSEAMRMGAWLVA